MEDTVDEIKANLPIETTAAYAGAMAMTETDAGNSGVMLAMFVILLAFTVALVLIRTRSLTPMMLGICGYVVWVINIDIKRYKDIVADLYNTIFGPNTSVTESLHIIIPCIAIIYSVVLAMVSASRAASNRDSLTRTD